MAEIRGADKAEKKGGRRSSLMSIAKRMKQFEQGRGDKPASVAAVKRQDYLGDDLSKRSSSPKPSSPMSADPYDLAHDLTPQAEDYTGGAEIPDIPLRRNMRAVNNADLGLDTLAALERILTAGHPQGPQHAEPPSSNNNNLGPYKSRTDNRYDDQCVDLDQDFKGEGRLLYPVSECSTEWESNSLPDVPEGGESPKPSLRRASTSSANYITQLSPRVGPPIASDLSVELPLAPPRDAAPFQTGLQPKVITPSLTATEFSRTEATSIQTDRAMTSTLPALQAKGVDDLDDGLQPVDEETMEPGSFDLVVPPRPLGIYSLERRSELLFSTEHLRVIFADPIFLTRFTSFVAMYRPPASTALVNYALDAVKAIRAVDWVNDIITRSLRPEGKPQHAFFAGAAPELTANESLRRRAAAAMEALARDELPAYVTHVWTDIVEVSMKRKITGSMPAHLRDMSEGLAEVFCISDPSRPDNPIVFASEEFHRTTQYGPDYVLGRNCRFLQGPKTNPFAVQRIREMLKQGKEHYETFLNYRRDGLPFMNLLMCTPLFDSKGQVRYHLGAQVDVSGLVKDCSGLESLRRLVDRDEEEQLARARGGGHYANNTTAATKQQRRDSGTDFDDIPGGGNVPVGTATTTPHARAQRAQEAPKDEFRLLAEMLNRAELDTVRRFGGRMHRSQQEEGVQYGGGGEGFHTSTSSASSAAAAANWHKPRVVLHDSSPPASPDEIGGDQRYRAGSMMTTDANGNISVAAPSIAATTASNATARPRSPAGGAVVVNNHHANNGHTGAAAGLSPSPLHQYQMTTTNNINSINGSSTHHPRPPTIFENYLVVRPYPSLRILFASRPMRVPGILQSHLMSRIGGSQRIHDELEQAFAMGQSVTAKVKWISGSGLRNANHNSYAAQQHHVGGGGGGGAGNNNNINNGNGNDYGSNASTASLNNNGRGAGGMNNHHNNSNSYSRPDTVGMDGRPRWIHCTPLSSTTGAVGVWVVVIVDEEGEASERAARRRPDFSTGPLINNNSNNAYSTPSTTTANHQNYHHHNHYQNGSSLHNSPHTTTTISTSTTVNGGGSRQQQQYQSSPQLQQQQQQQQRRQQQQQQQQRGQAAAWDEMSLTDFASMNRLPEDEDLRQHLRDMYEDMRRRERERGGGGGGGGGDWDSSRGGGGTKDNNNNPPPGGVGVARPGSRAGTTKESSNGSVGGGSVGGGGGGGGVAAAATRRVADFRRRYDSPGRSPTPDRMTTGLGLNRM